MSREVALDLPADADGARRAAEAARELLAGAGDEAAFACELAVAEACANVVEHAGAGAPALRVVLRRRDGRFSAAVCDRAQDAFRPPAAAALPPPEAESGRGLALMEACMDRIARVRRDGENRLLMARRLASGDGR